MFVFLADRFKWIYFLAIYPAVVLGWFKYVASGQMTEFGSNDVFTKPQIELNKDFSNRMNMNFSSYKNTFFKD